MPVLEEGEAVRGDGYIFLAGETASHRWIQFIKGTAAACFGIVAAVPFENRNKKQGQAHIGHENLEISVPAAAAADLRSGSVWDFPGPLVDTSDEKHVVLHSAASVWYRTQAFGTVTIDFVFIIT